MSTLSIVLAAIVVVLAIVIISAGVKVVPQSETRVIERLGRFHSVLSPGLNFIIPFIDRPKTIYMRRVESSVGGRPWCACRPQPSSTFVSRSTISRRSR